jgi:diacylglycerol kinase (ATP)
MSDSTSTAPGTENIANVRHHPGRTSGAKRLAQATMNSMEGIGACFKHEEAFRLEVYAGILLFPAAVVLPVGWLGSALLLFSLVIVLVVELLNSAVETVVDYISTDRHPLAKRAKDLASAAVFLSLIQVAAIWSLVLSAHWNAIVAWATGQ